MAAKAQPGAKPIMTDAGIEAKTGHGWDYWYAALDKAGAAKLDHKGITALLTAKSGIGAWWRQMIAVSYERARGIRAMNQKCDGQFSVGVSKVMPADLPKLYAAVANDATRKAWFPKGAFVKSSETKDKYFRGAWGKNGARLQIYFYAKGPGKAQIVVDVEKLTDSEQVESERAVWKKALERLDAILR
ncbi:MAG TPA: hypothetical protein VHU87_02110 [Rhizomicrobium sp.]|jgi:hypothetical protein|nr:hypothetical protein [Rhizomicrobium sp.]